MRVLGLRGRLTLLLGLAVLVVHLLAWTLVRRAVLDPFTEGVVRAHLEQVSYLAAEVEKGMDPQVLGEQLGLEIRVFPAAPEFVRREVRNRSPRCRRHKVRGRRLIACRGPRAPVMVPLSESARDSIWGLAEAPPPRRIKGRRRFAHPWLVVRRPLDVDRHQQRILFVLVTIATAVLILGALIATLVTRPLRTTVGAMERMASGDLTHRLEEGSSEAGEVARSFNRMADRITTLLEAERSLMAGISHELRTPLARLRLELELLRERDVPEKRLDAMEADVTEIDQLIGEVIESSRLSIGERALRLETFSLREVVEETLGQTPLPDHEVRLEDQSGDERVTGDRLLLARIIRNLLENAGKYAPSDSEIRISVGGQEIQVADEGPGVPPHELERLFEPFYRGERDRGGHATGYGLGLMISRQIAELHGGSLVAENQAQGGLKVTLRIPPSPPAEPSETST